MIDIVSIEQLSTGDTIIINTMVDEVVVLEINKIIGHAVETIVDGDTHAYWLEDPNSIIRVGCGSDEPIITLLSQKMHLKLTKQWENLINNSKTK